MRLRSLLRAKGLTITVVVTLALGIGANAAIFSVVRSVLLRPLVNRDADRLIYIRQARPGHRHREPHLLDAGDQRPHDRASRRSAAFGDFSTVDFTLIGFGEEPRVVKAGVVNGSFFDVMGLRPVLGRLLNAADDGPKARGRGGPDAPVLDDGAPQRSRGGRQDDPSRSGHRDRRRRPRAVGALSGRDADHRERRDEPAPSRGDDGDRPQAPHDRAVRPARARTPRWKRPAPSSPACTRRWCASIPRRTPRGPRFGLQVTTLREQLASPARTILLLLLAAAAVVFVIACSNVANLILARSVRREGELAMRAALGAGRGALRRTLLAESLVLCAAGAVLGLMLAGPLVTVAARYAARFSVRALEATVDAERALARGGAGRWWRPCCSPTFHGSRPPIGRAVWGWLSGSVRITPGTNRRLRVFATTQIACSFVLLAGAGMLVATLNALQTANTGYDMRQVLAIDVPPPATGVGGEAMLDFFQEATRRIGELPGVEGVAAGMVVPWRDRSAGLKFQFAFEGYQPADGEEEPDVPVPARLASILRRARCPDPRGPGLHGRGP